MKTFSEFMLIAEAVEDIFGTEQERKRVAERDAAQARRRAVRTGMSPEVEAAENKRKAFEKAGLSPEEARRRAYRNIKGNTTNVSGEDIRGSKPKASATQATPNPSQQPAGTTPPPPPKTPQQSPQASTPPKSQRGDLATTSPSASARPGLRTRLGRLAGPAAAVAGGVMDYKARREAGQSRARSAGGALTSGAGFVKGASLGFKVTPGPLPFKLAGAAVGGLVGDTAASAAYDYAADKTRPARQTVAKATGFDKFQQKQAAFKPGSGLSGLARAQQTVDTRGARQVAAKAGTYGARQGSALTGAGGPTTVNRQAGTLTSGGKTAKLSSTQLVRDPKTGQQRVGDLAYRGGKAVYLARPSVSSRDTSLAARVGRALNIGRYSKAAETQAAKQEYRTALKGTQQYQKQLGITPEKAKALKLPGK